MYWLAAAFWFVALIEVGLAVGGATRGHVADLYRAAVAFACVLPFYARYNWGQMRASRAWLDGHRG